LGDDFLNKTFPLKEHDVRYLFFFFFLKGHYNVGQRQEDSGLFEITGQSDPMGIHYKARTQYFDTKPLKQSNNTNFLMIIIKSNITNQITLKLLANASIS
jgi:predicted RNA-binding protein with PUA-like domain